MEKHRSHTGIACAETDTAVVPQVARDLMLRFDEKVRHYTVSHIESKH